MNKIIDLNKLDDNELEDIFNQTKAVIESRKVEGQFDVFEPKWRESYYFFDIGEGDVVNYKYDGEEFDMNISFYSKPRKTREAAEKDGELRRITKNIECRIAVLNRKQDWVCNFSDASQEKYCFWIDAESGAVELSVSRHGQESATRHCMSKETADQILQEFSHPHLRAFVTQEWVK